MNPLLELLNQPDPEPPVGLEPSVQIFDDDEKEEERPANPLTQLLDSGPDPAQERAILDVNAGKNAEEARRDRELSKKSGLPEEAIEVDRQAVERRVTADDIDAKTRNSPKTRGIMADLMVGPLMMDSAEVDSMVEIEWLANRGRDVTGALVGEVGGRGLTGASSLLDVMARNITGVIRAAGLEGLADFLAKDRFSGLPIPITPSQILRQPGVSLEELGEAVSSGEDSLSADIARGIGQFAGQAAVHIFTGGTATLPLLFAHGARILEQRGESSDATQVDKDIAIISGATITAVTERYGLDKILNRMPPKLKNALLRQLADLSIAGGIEAVQEVVEGILHNLTALALIDPNAKIFEGIEREAKAAGGAAVIFRALVNTIVKGRQIHSYNQRVVEVTRHKERLLKIFDTAGQSKVAAESPELYQEVLVRLVTGSDIETVHINAAGLQVFFQAAGNPEAAVEFFKDVGIEEAAIERAMQIGTDLEVDTAKFIQALKGVEIVEGVLAHVREEVGAATLAETDVKTEETKAVVEESIKQLKADLGMDTTEQDLADAQAILATAAGDLDTAQQALEDGIANNVDEAEHQGLVAARDAATQAEAEANSNFQAAEKARAEGVDTSEQDLADAQAALDTAETKQAEAKKALDKQLQKGDLRLGAIDSLTGEYEEHPSLEPFFEAHNAAKAEVADAQAALDAVEEARAKAPVREEDPALADAEFVRKDVTEQARKAGFPRPELTGLLWEQAFLTAQAAYAADGQTFDAVDFYKDMGILITAEPYAGQRTLEQRVPVTVPSTTAPNNGFPNPQAIIETANEAHATRLDLSTYVGGDEKFDLDAIVAEDELGGEFDGEVYLGVLPVSAIAGAENMKDGDVVSLDAVLDWDLFSTSDGRYPGEPYFGRIHSNELQIRLSSPELGEDGSANLEFKDRNATEQRLLQERVGEDRIATVAEALSHQNHHARAAAFRAALDQLGINYTVAGSEGIASEYIYVDPIDEDLDAESLKVRFADHSRQSVAHEDADFNIYDGNEESAIEALQAIATNPTYSSFDGSTLNLLQQAAEFGVTPQQLATELEAAGGDITKTPAFRFWFGAGAVVNADGTPRLVFHTTFSEFEAFEIGERELGVHIGSREAADNRVEIKRREEDFYGLGREELGEPRVLELYTNIQNPLRMPENRTGGWRAVDFKIEIRNGLSSRFEGVVPPELELTPEEEAMFFDEDFDFNGRTINLSELEDQELSDFFREWLGSKGFDGIVYTNKFEGGGDSYIAFNSAQVKSVFNIGTFDPADPRILRQDPPSREAMRIRQLAFENDVRSGNIDLTDPFIDIGEVNALRADMGLAPLLDQASFLAERTAAFDKLADDQRGDPEVLMVKAQRAIGGGVLSEVIEHVGDLTNRMADKYDFFTDGLGYDVSNKVRRGLRYLQSEYGFEREYKENLVSNAKRRGVSLNDHKAKIDAALKKYADAHRKLEVYNEPQRWARDAAVALGEQNWAAAEENLTKLDELYKDEDAYRRAAGEYKGQFFDQRDPPGPDDPRFLYQQSDVDGSKDKPRKTILPDYKLTKADKKHVKELKAKVKGLNRVLPVSYTHLTLPTKRIV